MVGEVCVAARGLVARTKRGPVFGPVDLTVGARQICVVHGPRGSGKSALLLALTGRFRGATGHLTICGIDAMAKPREAMVHTSIARLGDYVAPEDRLTVAESIEERAYLEGIPQARARARFDELEERLGMRMDRSLELEHLTTLERSLVSVMLVLIRPTRVIALDDADLRLSRADQVVLFDKLGTLLDVDDATLLASAVDAAAAPAGSVILAMPRLTPELDPEPLRPTSDPAGPDGAARDGAARDGEPRGFASPRLDPDGASEPSRTGSHAALVGSESDGGFWPWGRRATAVRRTPSSDPTEPDGPAEPHDPDGAAVPGAATEPADPADPADPTTRTRPMPAAPETGDEGERR